MTKKEIIEKIALSDVPPGSKLIERKIGKFTVSVHNNKDKIGGGIKLLLANHLVELLITKTAEFPDTPNAELLRRLYETFLDYNKRMIDSCIIEAVEEDIMLAHCQMVLRLRDISECLKIPFVEPEDAILM